MPRSDIILIVGLASVVTAGTWVTIIAGGVTYRHLRDGLPPDFERSFLPASIVTGALVATTLSLTMESGGPVIDIAAWIIVAAVASVFMYANGIAMRGWSRMKHRRAVRIEAAERHHLDGDAPHV